VRRVHHVGVFPNLEDQMCLFGIGESDDRVDELVYALSELKRSSTNDLSKLSIPDLSGPSR